MENKTFNRLDYTYKLFIVIALSIVALILAKDIFIPIAFAGFIAVVMLPAVKWMERKKINTVLAITLVLLGFTICLSLLGWLIIDQIVALVNDLPDIQTRLELFTDSIRSSLRKDFGVSILDQNNLVKDAVKSVSTYIGDILVSTGNLISLIIQIPIYIFLFLIYRDKFKLFFQKLLPDQEDFLWKTELENVLQGYVIGLALVTMIIASLNTIGLALLGIEHAIFFGLLSGLLTIIPYVGIFIGAALPAFLALVTKDSAWYAVGVVGIFSFVQFLEGNFITPRITGSKVSINALAAIVALLLGGKLLGIAGMILAVPAIGVFKIILGHTEHLKAFVILLEDTNGGNSKQKIEKSSADEEITTPPAS
ncbi:AI-2E family transporter [Chryseotalea sanaruensis]|uniref:AI-2E family transporter n=1 Tax=Chryseotalea sanaruensis TaxID=2482724 RepID=A0A401U4Y3_9BACT|nr:AI-2E family transporter [Chryseotalea sanaruensis]GCC49900.1 AI-2E family transporter [Chryseotalea sanaruensis]